MWCIMQMCENMNIIFHFLFHFFIADEHDKSKEVNYSLSPHYQDLLTSEDTDSDSSEDYVLYSNNRNR